MHQPRPRTNGTREHARFPCVMSVAITKQQADGLEMLAKADGLLTISDHVRLAIQSYLRDAGVLAHLAAMTDRAMTNGEDQEASHAR